MWTGLRRILVYVVLTVALFACVWASRVFLSPQVVELLMPVASILAVVLVAILGGLLPALPLGIVYGLLAAPPVARKALGIAVGASVVELLLASVAVPWWSFFTWWVLPLECLTLVIFFPAAAWAAARLRHASLASA
jgi:hypothetical protein